MGRFRHCHPKINLYMYRICVILTCLGPNGTRFARCHFRVQKSLDFQGPLLLMALVIDLPALESLHPAPYKQEVHLLLED